MKDYKLVPLEPTRAMIDAAVPQEEEGYAAMYTAMLAAAPLVEQKPLAAPETEQDSAVAILLEALTAIQKNELDAARAQDIADIALIAYRKHGGGS